MMLPHTGNDSGNASTKVVATNATLLQHINYLFPSVLCEWWHCCNKKLKIIVEVLGNQPFPTLFGNSPVAKRAGFWAKTIHNRHNERQSELSWLNRSCSLWARNQNAHFFHWEAMNNCFFPYYCQKFSIGCRAQFFIIRWLLAVSIFATFTYFP